MQLDPTAHDLVGHSVTQFLSHVQAVLRMEEDPHGVSGTQRAAGERLNHAEAQEGKDSEPTRGITIDTSHAARFAEKVSGSVFRIHYLKRVLTLFLAHTPPASSSAGGRKGCQNPIPGSTT